MLERGKRGRRRADHVRGPGDPRGAHRKATPAAGYKRAVENVQPLLEVKSRRIGGATYQVPVEVRPRTGLALGYALAASARHARAVNKPMALRLAAERIDAARNGVGAAEKRREDMHKMAESNRAFAHYRW